MYRNLVEAGCDEAGRGCLAGPVSAAAVILPRNYKNPVLNDSKKLTSKQRYFLRDEIMDSALAWHVAFIDNREIDSLNILRATFKAMHLAIEGLQKVPQHLLIDGNSFHPFGNIRHTTIVGGDSLFLPIAAASVLAKTFRDEFMEKIHKEYPCYGWNTNKGYGTLFHRKAIMKHGISPYHRKTFSLFNSQLSFGFKDLPDHPKRL